jgi:hypothetical protein
MSFAVRDEIRVMVAPFATYRRLLGGPLPGGWRTVLRRPALMALVIGGFVTVTNTGDLLPTLLVGTTVFWLWVPLLQLLIATPLMALARRRQARLAPAVDLFFVGHGPWSLWLLGLTLVMMLRIPEGLRDLGEVVPMLLSALLPIAWTCVILFAFCRTVLGLSGWLAAGWTVLYQAALWFATYLFVGAVTFRMWPFSPYWAWRP